MKHLQILGGLLLAGALLAPIAVAGDRDDHYDRRYYDRDGRDYHVYNHQEDRAYRVYLGERRRDYREFRRINRSQRQEYFRWRHQHPDRALFNVEIK